jgi:hypothetical protein
MAILDFLVIMDAGSSIHAVYGAKKSESDGQAQI